MATRWFLRGGRLNTNINATALNYRKSIKALQEIIPTLIMGTTKEYLNEITTQFVASGLTPEIAKRVASSRVMYTALNISEVSAIHEFDLQTVAQIYFQVGGQFKLVRFRDLLAKTNRVDQNSNLARLALRDDLDSLQRRITINIMQSSHTEASAEKVVANWYNHNAQLHAHWKSILVNIQGCQPDDYTMMFVALRELSEMIESISSTERFKQLALHDSLTMLPNRELLMERLFQIQQRAKLNKTFFAVLFIDLDKFKSINDVHGHEIGDLVLKETTARLARSVRSTDTVARMGGDEFVILQADLKSLDNANVLADKLDLIIKAPMVVKGIEIIASASIGIAVYPTDGEDVIDVIDKADKAMYRIKKDKENVVVKT